MAPKVGFTGTRHGMSGAQKEALFQVFDKYYGSEFHHGDCWGADAEAHDIAIHYNMRIHIHPPSDEKARAFKTLKVVRTSMPKPYLQRNHDIVDSCDILIAAPHTDKEILRSGTWATVRYARRKNVPVILLPR